jgi:hypothetical protein
MKSNTHPSFWEAYGALDEKTRQRAQRTYRLWMQNPFHLSLHFKCINAPDQIWSVRVTLGIRALGIWEGDTFTWFWIGNHEDYERYFG